MVRDETIPVAQETWSRSKTYQDGLEYLPALQVVPSIIPSKRFVISRWWLLNTNMFKYARFLGHFLRSSKPSWCELCKQTKNQPPSRNLLRHRTNIPPGFDVNFRRCGRCTGSKTGWQGTSPSLHLLKFQSCQFSPFFASISLYHRTCDDTFQIV